MRRQSTRTHSPLVAAAVDLGFQAHLGTAPYIKRTDTLGTVYFMGAKAHQVNWKGLQINGFLTRALRCIDVQQYTALAGKRSDCSQILHHADLVVDMH